MPKVKDANIKNLSAKESVVFSDLKKVSQRIERPKPSPK